MSSEKPHPTTHWSIEALSASYRSGSATPTQVVTECLRRMEGEGKQLNCFITALGDSAIRSAEESGRRHRAGRPLGPLDGVPIAVKDVFYIKGVRCTAGSKILAENVASYDSETVARLKKAGAVIVGTTNMHEFAAGVTSVNPHFGAVKNPWDPGRVAGGSSGGSAVAVAAGMAAGGMGTDTAGSVRIPAALCGILGFKPTYGRVSRLGVVPLAASLDTVGILALTAWDTAAILQVLAGHDVHDVTTASEDVPDYVGSLAAPLSGARVGVVRDYFLEELDPRVEENFQAFEERLRQIGCVVAEADIHGVREVYDRWLVIRRAEATAFHLRWMESCPELYGDDVRALLELGKGVLAVDYVNAVNARPATIEKWADVMKGFDFLMAPTTCIPAPRIGETKTAIKGKDKAVYSALNSLTLPFNYLGFPAVSVPSGFVGGLPLGVQIVGRLFDETSVLRLVKGYEEAFGQSPLPGPPERGGTSP